LEPEIRSEREEEKRHNDAKKHQLEEDIDLKLRAERVHRTKRSSTQKFAKIGSPLGGRKLKWVAVENPISGSNGGQRSFAIDSLAQQLDLHKKLVLRGSFDDLAAKNKLR
jgi:hypothetical protein